MALTGSRFGSYWSPATARLEIATSLSQEILCCAEMAAPAQQNHLVVNLVQLLPEFSGGIEMYARELLPRIVDALPDWRVSALVNEEGSEAYRAWDDRVEWIDCGFSWHDRFRRLTWESTSIPRRVRQLQPTLVHNMTNTALRRPGCRQLSTTFDATQVLQPAPSLGSAAFRRLLTASARRSDRIVTISNSAAGDIERAFGVSPQLIDVVHLAARKANAGFDRAALEQRFDLPAGSTYFLTPASRRLNKNIPRLVRAFARLEKEHAPLLLLAGADGGADEEIGELVAELGLSDRVRFLGWVTDDELDGLYANAEALVFPSLMEGFGLPILEAMQCGCPVATSDRSSMPEVAGDHAVYFDPESEQSIADAMAKLLGDDNLRARLRSEGLTHASEFSWERAARETVAIYDRLIGDRLRP